MGKMLSFMIPEKSWIHHIFVTCGLCVVVIIGGGCQQSSEGDNHSAASHSGGESPMMMVESPEDVPEDFKKGHGRFHEFCSRCHGPSGSGTNNGPPLIHKIYEPSHHADITFYRAAQNGVRAHHWKFGNMPKIEGVTKEQVKHIVAYIRWKQRQAGIQ